MKRRKNIIVSAITCMFSICLMIFGVYAASNPSVTIGGQVSYSARDAKVLVLGKVNGQSGEDQTNKVAYPTVADTQNPTESEKVVSATQYMGFTNGTGANISADNLSPWTMNATHGFYEDTTGIRPITISFKMTNQSNYPVVASIDFSGVTDANLESHNLTRTTTGIKDKKVYLDKNITKEISVTYTVANDSKSVSGDGLLDMSITFEKTVFPTPTNAKSQQGETMQSDWEYQFDGDSFTITKFVGTFPTKDSDGNSTLVIPSQITCDDGKTYPVKTLGKITEEQVNTAIESEDESVVMELYGGAVIVDLMQMMDESTAATYLQTLPTNIVVSDGIETISPVALMYATGVQTLPNSVTYIGALSMAMTSVQTLNLPNLTTIGINAFSECALLTSVIIPSSVSKIGDNAFFGCESLVSVEIQEGVTSIGQNAFANCPALKSVSIEQEDCTKILCAEEAFGSVSSLNENFKIYVANESFKTAQNWSTYKDYMVVGNIVTKGDWTVNLDKNNLTCDIIKYVGDTTKTELTIPATFEYKNKTYDVVAVGSENADDPFGFCGDITGETALMIMLFSDEDLNSIADMRKAVENYVKQNPDTFGSVKATIPYFKTIVIEQGVQRLNQGLFYACLDLESISIPQSVTTISEKCFTCCWSLKSIQLPQTLSEISNETFQSCANLQSIVIPNNVTKIGESAFDNCQNLTSVTLSNKLTSIGNEAFRECYRLAEVINNSTLNITKGSQDNGAVSQYAVRVVTSGSSQTTTNGDFKFVLGDDTNNYLIGYFGSKKSEIVLPSTPNNYKIKSYSFKDNTDLVSLTVPSCVSGVDTDAFLGCDKLSEVINFSSVNIKNYCNPVRIATSGTSQVQTKDDFKYILGDDNNTYLIGYFGSKSFKNGEVTLPQSSYNWIKSYAFEDISMPDTLTIPDCVVGIGDNAFARGGSGLTTVIIPDSVKYIGNTAFYSSPFFLEGVENLTIGTGVISVGKIACKGTLTIKATTPPTAPSDMFNCMDGGTVTKIFVPSASVDAYKTAAGWSEYADKIFGID